MTIVINGKEVTRFKIFEEKQKLLIWLLVNLVIFWLSTRLFGFSLIKGFFVSIVVYVIIVNIAISNFIELLILSINDVRRLATSKEKERLICLFDEVKAKASVKHERAEHFNLYIQDTISINAFAIGRKSIVVTRGLLEVMNDDEIKAILAHEFSHIINGDTQLKLLTSIATTIYAWIFIFIRMLFQIAENVSNMSEKSMGFLGLIAGVIKFALDVIIIAFTFTGNIILMSYSRDSEFIADKYAYDLGYGNELTSALYKLYDMQISDKKQLTERMQSSHPKVAFRIEQLESMAIYQQNTAVII